MCAVRDFAHRLTTRAEMDIADPGSVRAMLERLRPWAVINTAGYVRVDQAESEPDRCFRENAGGPAALAEACAEAGVRLVTFSTDLVFDGRKGTPYREGDPVAPLNVYGRSKAEAEARVAAALPSALVVRTAAFFGPWDGHNFVAAVLRALSDPGGGAFRAAADGVVSPTYVPDLAGTCLDLLLDGAEGLMHVASAGEASWADLARAAAEEAGLDAGRVEGVPTAALGLPAPRPPYSALASGRAWVMPDWRDALRRCLRHDEPVWRTDRPSAPACAAVPAGERMGAA
jgi:dTDP-4-dehydrorhamnose reductase